MQSRIIYTTFALNKLIKINFRIFILYKNLHYTISHQSPNVWTFFLSFFFFTHFLFIYKPVNRRYHLIISYSSQCQYTSHSSERLNHQKKNLRTNWWGETGTPPETYHLLSNIRCATVTNEQIHKVQGTTTGSTTYTNQLLRAKFRASTPKRHFTTSSTGILSTHNPSARPIKKKEKKKNG